MSKLVAPAARNCTRCPRSAGVYYWGAVINGVPQYAGTCFRCDGTGRELPRKAKAPRAAAPVERVYMAATPLPTLRVSDAYEVVITIVGKRWVANLVAGPAGSGPLMATSTVDARTAAVNLADRLKSFGYSGRVRIIAKP
jgi:hypothetical protein